MTQIQDFKENAYQSTWEYASKLFRPILVPTVLVTILMMAMMTGIYQGFLAEPFEPILEEVLENPNADPFERNTRIQEYILGLDNVAAIFAVIYGFTLVAMLISAWFINLLLIISQNKILETDNSFGDSLKASFNRDVWRIFLAFIIINIVFGLLGQVMSIVGITSLGIGLLWLAILAVLAIRFLAVAPAIVHGQLGLRDAFAFSWKNVNWRRSIIIFLIGIAAYILLFIGGLVSGFIMGMLGVFGAVLLLVGVLALTTFALSLFTSIQTALFFRYADVEIDDGQSTPDSHLVTED